MTKQGRNYWKTLMQEHAESDQSLREFCVEHKLKRATFIWWRKQLRREERKVEPKRDEMNAASPGAASTRPARPTRRTTYRPRRTPEEMRAVVSSWSASGMSARAYAEKHDLSAKALYRWKSKLFENGVVPELQGPRVVGPRRSRKRAESFTAELVDYLAVAPATQAPKVAAHLGEPYQQVLRELRELEALGLVFREGKARGTRWSLG